MSFTGLFRTWRRAWQLLPEGEDLPTLYHTTDTMNDTQQQTLTPGQRAMSVTFNPGGRRDVTELKQGFADLYDLLNHHCEQAVEAIGEDRSSPLMERSERISDLRRNQALTKTWLEMTQMLAVKAVTR